MAYRAVSGWSLRKSSRAFIPQIFLFFVWLNLKIRIIDSWFYLSSQLLMTVLSIQLSPTGEVNIGLKKQPTFNDATNGLPTKWRLRNAGLQKLCVNICVEEEWFELKLNGYFFWWMKIVWVEVEYLFVQCKYKSLNENNIKFLNFATNG